MALLEAVQLYAPDLPPALAADFAAALASPRGALNADMFDNVVRASIGFEGLRERGKYLNKLRSTEMSPADAAWISVSARRLVTLCRAITSQSQSSDPVRQAALEWIAWSEFGALAAMGWGSILLSIAERIGAASIKTMAPDPAQREHLTAISEEISPPVFNSPRFPTKSPVPSKPDSELPTDTSHMNSLGLLRGIKRIADYLELPPKLVERLHGSGDLPTFKIRSRICARKVTLDKWILDQERAGLAERATTTNAKKPAGA